MLGINVAHSSTYRYIRRVAPKNSRWSHVTSRRILWLHSSFSHFPTPASVSSWKLTSVFLLPTPCLFHGPSSFIWIVAERRARDEQRPSNVSRIVSKYRINDVKAQISRCNFQLANTFPSMHPINLKQIKILTKIYFHHKFILIAKNDSTNFWILIVRLRFNDENKVYSFKSFFSWFPSHDSQTGFGIKTSLHFRTSGECYKKLINLRVYSVTITRLFSSPRERMAPQFIRLILSCIRGWLCTAHNFWLICYAWTIPKSTVCI